MSEKINVPVEDKDDAHLGYVAISSADICPICRKIECECENDVK